MKQVERSGISQITRGEKSAYLERHHIEEDGEKPVQRHRWKLDVEILEMLMEPGKLLTDQFLEDFLVDLCSC